MRLEVHRGVEPTPVVVWRYRQLVDAGFPAALARRVATGYDLHALIELVERGCPPPLAVRILAPVEGGPR